MPEHLAATCGLACDADADDADVPIEHGASGGEAGVGGSGSAGDDDGIGLEVDVVALLFEFLCGESVSGESGGGVSAALDKEGFKIAGFERGLNFGDLVLDMVVMAEMDGGAEELIEEEVAFGRQLFADEDEMSLDAEARGECGGHAAVI